MPSICNDVTIPNNIGNYDDDILQPVTDTELNELFKLYKENLPASLIEYNFLLNHFKSDAFYKKAKIEPRFFNKFYTHRNGDLLINGTFVAIIEGQITSVYVCTLESDFSELQACITQSKRIDWHTPLVLACFYQKYDEFLLDLVKSKELPIAFRNPCDCWGLPMREARNFELKIPNDYQLKPLHDKDAVIINEHWPHRSIGSTDFAQTLISIYGGVGIFNPLNELVSWILINEYNALGMLQTVDLEKGKGLGVAVTKALCQKIAENQDRIDDTIFTFIMINNEISQKVFKKLGFTVFGRVSWMKLN